MDTLKHYQALVDSGMTGRQAKALVYALRDAAREVKQSRKIAEQIHPEPPLFSFIQRLLNR
jgi:hypothetical protein